MRLLFQLIHPRCRGGLGNVLLRRAARGIVLRERHVLLMYTARYNDYSLPGGGVSHGEELHEALSRELEEETGARNVRVTAEFGRVRELRPHWGEHDAVDMESFVFHCQIDEQLEAPRMESYEHANGMRPVWVALDEAIAHNRGVLARAEPGMGLSIERETRLFELILAEQVEGRLAA